MLRPDLLPAFAVMLVLCVSGYFMGYGLGPWLGIAETVVVVVLYFIWNHKSTKKTQELMKYMDSLNLQFDNASQNAIFSIPLPVVVVKLVSHEVIWCNDRFAEMDKTRKYWFSTDVRDILQDFSLNWIEMGKTFCNTPVRMENRLFRVSGCVVNPEDEENARICALFLVDITRETELETQLKESRAVVAIIQLDNYDELNKNISGNERTFFMASVDARVAQWTEKAHGIFVKSERDKFLFVFEQRDFAALEKFELLDTIRNLPGSGPFPATVSIGVGQEGKNFQENVSYARLALDMALSRGGDQAVIKDAHNYAFFGGRTREVERRTRVRARVIANALRDLIDTASNVIIVGHKFSDMDAIGAAIGLSSICRKLGTQVHVVIDLSTTTAKPLYDRISALPEYADTFVTPTYSERLITPQTLLIVVDVNRSSFVDAPELLKKASKIVVIDHHRRVADYIENPALSLHEPYASSTCELVSDLAQYLVQPSDFLRVEAESMLAGITLDTKNFTMKTGVRTFEAAAFLRRAGADTITVKQLFANDMERNRELCGIIRTAERYRDMIAIAYAEDDTSREIGGQAADDLLNIQGIQASFVIFRHAGGTQISARSLGQINVQLIMERMGGGGSLTGAGAQLGDRPVSEVSDDLRGVIENYFTLV